MPTMRPEVKKFADEMFRYGRLVDADANLVMTKDELAFVAFHRQGAVVEVLGQETGDDDYFLDSHRGGPGVIQNPEMPGYLRVTMRRGVSLVAPVVNVDRILPGPAARIEGAAEFRRQRGRRVRQGSFIDGLREREDRSFLAAVDAAISVQAEAEANLFFVDASRDRIVIGRDGKRTPHAKITKAVGRRPGRR